MANDTEKKLYFKEYLESQGFTNIDIPSDPYCIYDISGTLDNTEYYYELKVRSVTSTQYGDSIIELSKYNNLKGLQSPVYVVNFFTDCFHIHPLLSEHENQDHYCQKTNNWDRHKIRKVLISYKNTNKSRREYNIKTL